MEVNSEIGSVPKDTSREDDAGATFVLESKGPPLPFNILFFYSNNRSHVFTC